MPSETINDVSGRPAERSFAERPRVLHLVGSFGEGGSERQALQLASLMHQAGSYCVQLASLNPAGVLRSEAEALRVEEVLTYPLTSFYDGNFARQLGRCAAHLRKCGISVVHSHEFYSNVFGMAAAKLAGVRVRIASRRDLGSTRNAAQLWVERRAYQLAHAVVANSQAVRQKLIAEGVPGRKIAVIYNGLEFERVRPRPGLSRAARMAALGLSGSPECQLVTIVANFREPVKDQATFLRAARLVHRQRPNARFVLAGEGGLITGLRALAEELGLKERAAFIGRCDQIGELLAISDVCVLSSKSEGFSNAILEYMAAGRPVVATDVGGAAECIVEKETGYLVPAGCPQSMAERIISILSDQARSRAMGEQGRRLVEDRFSKRVQLDRTQQLYSELLSTASKQVVAGFTPGRLM